MSNSMSPGFPRPRIGVSSCLLGQEVRYDGGHKRDAFVSVELARFADFVPLCPEVGIGLGVPRPTIRLVGAPSHPSALGRDDPSMDVTRRLERFAESHIPSLAGISGYVLKKDSPSCGMERVKVYPPEGGAAVRKGSGIFARELMMRMPLLPVEEEGRLNDPVLRENFVCRLFVFDRWQRLEAENPGPGDLVGFHSDHKYLVMAHSQAAYRRLGQLLSDLKRADLHAVRDLYITELMTALKRRVGHKGHVNVLQHMMGYLKRRIDTGDKAELAASIESYRRGEVPLVVPVTLLRHYFRRNPDPYMERQVYLRPYPEELRLRNAI